MAKLNTKIRGAQIADAVAGDGLEWTSDDILGLDLKSTSGLSIDTAELKLDLNNLAAVAIDPTADSIAIIDATDDSTGKESVDDVVTALAGDGIMNSSSVFAVDVSDFAGTGLKDDGSENLEVDLYAVGEVAVDVAADSFVLADNSDSDATKRDTIADLMTAVAGTGLTATAGVLAVDDYESGIIEADILYENESDNCTGSQLEFTLAQTPIANSVQVYLNGLIQENGSGKDYTIAATTITFVIAPSVGDILMVHYIQDN